MGELGARPKQKHGPICARSAGEFDKPSICSLWLAAVVRASIDKPALAKTLKLQATQKIILAQSVGYPKK